jgi:hypothetical protein
MAQPQESACERGHNGDNGGVTAGQAKQNAKCKKQN